MILQRLGSIVKSKSSIQQGLADGEPDVDAIWRITHLKNISLTKYKSIS
jgi:hypothetical protein